jgi:hypothetical protein
MAKCLPIQHRLIVFMKRHKHSAGNTFSDCTLPQAVVLKPLPQRDPALSYVHPGNLVGVIV